MLELFISLSSYYKPDDDDGISLIALWFFLPFVIAGLYWLRAKKINFQWHHGSFNPSLAYTKDNLLNAYIYLAAQLIAKDRQDIKGKMKYLESYFRKHFQNSDFDYREALTYSYRNPKQINSVTNWMNSKMKKKSHRLQTIYFLTGLCTVDGKIIPQELRLLETIAFSLKISTREFQSIVGMYESYERTSRENHKQKSSSYQRATSISQKSNACKILGVSESVSFIEIKKAYRRMVKLHHPDRFHNDSIEQQKIAKAKFITIQKAYEVLEKLMG